MVSMQRSLSSPVRTCSSETVFLTPSRQKSPGTSSSKAHEDSAKSASYDPRSSLWPSSTPNAHSLLRSDEKKKAWPCHRAGSGTTGKPKSHIAQPEVPIETYNRCDLDVQHHHGAPTSLLDRIPLPLHVQPNSPDRSQPTSPDLTEEGESATLQELAHVARLSKYQERKRADARVRLQRHLISTALSARLTRCGDTVHRSLVDSFRKDDKDGFSMLYNAMQDVKNSCDELRRYAFLEPDLEPTSLPVFGSSEHLDTLVYPVTRGSHPRTMIPFLHDLSTSSRKALLDFLRELRTNPEYLATRICALSSSELNAFLGFHKGMEPVESVLPFQGRTASRYPANASKRSSTSLDIERLLSFQRHDPLSVLIYSCFANSSGPDSSEDKRRTDIWATVLAKLVQQPKSNSEQFLISVLNIWIAMRDWSGKPSMEWYLMKLLEEGAFILDRAEDQHGTRFNLSDWNPADEAAAKKFYDKAVHGLFELVDDDDQTGIPDGLLELGNAILRKLDRKYVESTSRWLVWRCLFFVFLLGVVVHPESYGMLAEYHITPYAREKILKKVAMQAYDYVSSIWSGKSSATVAPAEVPPRIRGHVQRILARFQGSQSKISTAKLLPARSVTSLKETVEVRPYLILSPRELVTLVNALFPERRPMSSMSSTLRSGAASVSGLSMTSPQASANNVLAHSLDAASLSSTSFSSGVSDGTTAALHSPKEVQPSERSPKCSSLPVDPDTQRKANKYEDDGYHLRLAIHELNQSLGTEAVQGLCHPCAERWAVLFISPDGKTLSTKMTYDQSHEVDDDEHSTDTDLDGNNHIDGQEIGKDYCQLRDAILRLVEEYETPCDLENEGPKVPQLTNRASKIRRYGATKPVTQHRPELSYKIPRQAERAEPTATSGIPSSSYQDIKEEDDDKEEPVLIRMLRAASLQSKAQEDFVSSHLYWRTLKHLSALDSSSLRANGYAALINIFSRGPRKSLQWSAAALEEYDAWLVWLRQSQERHEASIDRMMKRIRSVRDKMWYVTDVRNSKEYSHSQDICHALKTMGMPRRWISPQRPRANVNRASGSSFLYRTQSQIMDLLAAPEEQGGPNKLSDEQCQMTADWLQKCDVENFCPGEERIHRFSCEVDKCLTKLVGETIREAPVLWSSDLYRRERAVYDRIKGHERDQTWHSDDGMTALSESERRRLGSPSLKPGYIGWDIRRNTSRSPSETSRINFTKPTSISDVVDGHDYFGRSSPVHALDTISTFWSPFQPSLSPGSVVSKAYSPTTSLTNLSTTFSGSLHNAPLPSSSSVSTGRPGTSASSNETIFQQHAENEKIRFLRELRQTLTSLLLSDFGSQVLARGSETDQWFQTLGQQCIDRKSALDRQARQPTDMTSKEGGNKSSIRPRVIEKKKSFSNLRDAGETTAERPAKKPQGEDDLEIQPRDDGTLSETTHKRTALFPFKKSYRRLLSIFTVNPNPFAKLKALNELQNLIATSILSRPSKTATGTMSNLFRMGDNKILIPQTSFDGTINGIRERRSHVNQAALHPPKYAHQVSRGHEGQETRHMSLNGDIKTELIAHEMQSLFRDAGIRPKSLFRDLQLIASFVPSSVLDQPECGRAFWNVGLAALKLKSEACLTMVEMADEIIAAHTWSRKSTNEHVVMSEQKLGDLGTLLPASTMYNLEDVGRMWAITAKEGYPAAQRELALFYLSNPEFVERTTLPLSQPRDVFKQAVMERYGKTERSRGSSSSVAPGSFTSAAVNVRMTASGSSSAGDRPLRSGKEGDVRNDVSLMCVAVHWMEAAEHGGDELATSFLRQNEFMGFE